MMMIINKIQFKTQDNAGGDAGETHASTKLHLREGRGRRRDLL